MKSKKIVSAILALILTLTAVSFSGCQNAPGNVDPDRTYEYQGPGKDGNYVAGDGGAGVKFLTSRTFATDRQKETVDADFAAALAGLTAKLLASCEKDNKDSTMISSLSIVTALAMAANGADGKTLDQMLNVIGCGLDLEGLNQQLFNFYASLTNTESASLKDANSVWLTNSPRYSVNENYLRRIENTFDADIVSVDFTSPTVVDDINGWCSDKTDGMIPGIVDDNIVSEYTVMCLLNALCFDALWSNQIEDAVIDGKFHGYDGDTTVKLMHTKERRYVSGKDVTGFIKYYEGANYAFVALLPDEKVTVAEYLASLDGKTFIDLVEKASWGDVVAMIPEFSSDYSVELNDILVSLGMTDAFDGDLADFSGMGRMNDGGNVYISSVIHKTHIDVDPSGTRAAAVTAVIMDKATAVQEHKEPKQVILDRPFVYAIIDTASGVPVFMGTCENVK